MLVRQANEGLLTPDLAELHELAIFTKLICHQKCHPIARKCGRHIIDRIKRPPRCERIKEHRTRLPALPPYCRQNHVDLSHVCCILSQQMCAYYVPSHRDTVSLFCDTPIVRMSTYQGTCGSCGSSSPVLPSADRQLSGAQRTNLLSAAIVYEDKRTSGKTQFSSAAEYMRYKTARAMAATPLCTAGRPPQSAIVEALIITSGCHTP
jgi:hypothetical protein